MNKLTFYDYFPQKKKGRPPTTQINILRYLSRYGKTRRTNIANYFGKNNQEINDAIEKLMGQDLITNYCDICKTKIENYDSWKHHKISKKHKTKLQIIKKNETIEKAKPLIIATKKGLEVIILDPLENREYNYADGDKLQKVIWGVITTKQFWNVLTDIFYNSDDINNLENICNTYENNVLGIFRESICPYYFRRCLKKFKDYNKNVFLLQKIKGEEIFFEDLILKIIANSKSLDVSKLHIVNKIKKSYRGNIDIFEKHFERLLSNGIIEKISKTKQETYEITHLGLILLFHLLQIDTIFFSKPPPQFKKYIDSMSSPEKRDEKLFNMVFENIRKKYSYLLPMILKDGNYLRLNLTKIGFLKIFEELYFSDNDEQFFGNHNFHNFRKFYEIRDIDFGKKLDNYIDSYSLTKIPMTDLFKIMTKSSKSNSKKLLKLHKKIIDSEKEYGNSLVHIKNEYDRKWVSVYSAMMFFDNHRNFRNNKVLLRKQLSVNFKRQIITSIENKITFDFYSLFAKYNSGFDINFSNNKIENWYGNQLEQLSEYVSHYFDKIML